MIRDRTSVTFRTPSLSGIPVTTAEGVTIGTPRQSVLDAGGWDVWDSDGDGVADYLGVGAVEVPGTQSLSREGETGVTYIALTMSGDVVSAIMVPANDFSDL